MALDFLNLFEKMQTGDDKATKSPKANPSGDVKADAAPLGSFDDDALLDLWKQYRKESLDDRWIFERQWHRNILYVLGRQWIEYFARSGGWKDKRMASWIPRPVTNKCKETLQAIRAMFASIKLGANVRPNGQKPENVSAASTGDELVPLLHEDHNMDDVLNEDDFWLIVTGNSFLHTFLDYDIKHGTLEIRQVQCVACGEQAPETSQECPVCGAANLQPALDESGEQIVELQPKGKPVTIPLSPLEVAFNNSYARFDDLPYIIRLRWRTKSWFENHPVLKDMVEKISWQKSPNDQSLQLFKSLASHNDLGVAPAYLSDGLSSGSDHEEGIPEFEVWVKPNGTYPKGLVFRVIGDKDPQVVHLEETEALPGPLPYMDADGNPLFTFAHAGYDHVGGRILASGPIDIIVEKQNQLNQLDSGVQLTIQRMSNPVWLKPKGAEILELNGVPGLVVEWNSLVLGGTGKPERLDGVGPHPSLFTIREQYLKDIEELSGTFDIMKGAKPSGDLPFSALQLLVERSQARFSTVFTSRGKMYRSWVKFALELEREFGPDERTKAILTPARQWTFQNFKRASLQGSISVIIEDGTAAPKTALGMRAALEHASQLGMLNMQDPDQRYEGLRLFGLTRMAPTLDINVQAALQKQQAFEEWAADPQAQQAAMQQTEQSFARYDQTLQQVQPTGEVDPMTGQPVQPPMPPPPSILEFTPLKWLRWYDPTVHRQEFVKWANGDRIRELLKVNSRLESLLDAHIQEIDNAMTEQVMRQQALVNPQPPQTPSSGAMGRSNTESTSGNEPRGQGQGAQNAGPR
jgi:hypothetical protein